MKAKEVAGAHAPHIPKSVQINPIRMLDRHSRTVHGHLHPQLDEHGSEEEDRARHGRVASVGAVAQVDGEAVRSHEEIEKSGWRESESERESERERKSGGRAME